MQLRKTVSFICLLLYLTCHGQDAPSKSLTWFQYKGSGTFGSSKWGAMVDLQHRRVDFVGATSQHLIRPGITYQLGNQFVVTAGTALFWHNIAASADDAVYRKEVRPFQFLQWRQAFPKFEMRHKFRFEQRFNRKTEQQQVLPGYRFNYRVGYRLEVVYPLSEHIVLNAYEELLINFGREIINEHLDQNRMYLGLRFKRRSLTYKTGYLWLITPLRERSGFEHSHILRVGVSHKW